MADSEIPLSHLHQLKSDIKMSSSQSQEASCSSSKGMDNSKVTINKASTSEIIIHLHTDQEQVKARRKHMSTGTGVTCIKENSQSCHVCVYCGESFGRIKSFNCHKRPNPPELLSDDCEAVQLNIGDDAGMTNPQKCWDCGYVGDGLNELMKHKQTEHPNTVKFTCKFCGQVFAERKKLDQHKKTVHQSETQVDKGRKKVVVSSKKDASLKMKKRSLKEKIDVLDWHRANGSKPSLTAAKWGCNRKTIAHWDKNYDLYASHLSAINERKRGKTLDDDDDDDDNDDNKGTYPRGPTKRQSWTVEEKVEIVDWFRSAGRNTCMTVSTWGCDRKSLRQWDSKYEQLKKLSETDNKMKNKRKLHGGHPMLSQELDSEVLCYFKTQYDKGHIMPFTEISVKAQETAERLGIEGFKASSGWIKRWKIRNGITVGIRKKKGLEEEPDYTDIPLTVPGVSSDAPTQVPMWLTPR
ncbi:uncharacterized protein [Amphiura filiformis]|uniref:uncharacterized protein n=1 Tax=Amphiura filiformis TaxID=82378 RepID=UPI003B20C491